MEWHNDDKENMEVDIGYVSKMEIMSSMPSMKSYLNDNEGVKRTISNQFIKPMFENTYNVLIDKIKWDDEMSVKEAGVRLEQYFFRFKQVDFKYFKRFYNTKKKKIHLFLR